MIERELTFPTLKPLPLGYRVVQLDSGHFLGIGPERNGSRLSADTVQLVLEGLFKLGEYVRQ